MTFYCTDEDQNGQFYNQLATLTFTGFESAIKQLFYFNYPDDIQASIYYTVRSAVCVCVAICASSFASFLSLNAHA